MSDEPQALPPTADGEIGDALGIFSSSRKKPVQGYTEDLMRDEQTVSLSRAALADFVSYYGRESFSIPIQARDALERRCEQLREFLMGGTPVHTRDLEIVDLDEAPPSYPHSPNLTDTIHFLYRRRKSEAEYVRTTLPALKSAFLGLVLKVQEGAQADARGDEEVRTILAALGESITQDDPIELRSTAKRALHSISRSLDARSERTDARLAEMGNQIKQLREKLLQAETESVTDPMTRLLNRRGVEDRLGQEFMVSGLTQERLAVAMIDIDFFKNVNDKYGHLVGDETIKLVADKLTETFKERTALVARWGGEEFLVGLPDTTEVSASKRLNVFRERLADAVMRLEDGRKLSVTASIGVASTTRDVSNVTELLRRADATLYEAKRRGRNQVRRWSKLTPGDDAATAA